MCAGGCARACLCLAIFVFVCALARVLGHAGLCVGPRGVFVDFLGFVWAQSVPVCHHDVVFLECVCLWGFGEASWERGALGGLVAK